MIFRLSQKLNTKIKAGSMDVVPLDENPFADWSAHLFSADRTQYIIGSLNDLIYHASVWLTEGELSPHDVGFKLNNIPFSPLANSKPREAFKKLVPADNPTSNQ